MSRRLLREHGTLLIIWLSPLLLVGALYSIDPEAVFAGTLVLGLVVFALVSAILQVMFLAIDLVRYRRRKP